MIKPIGRIWMDFQRNAVVFEVGEEKEETSRVANICHGAERDSNI